MHCSSYIMIVMHEQDLKERRKLISEQDEAYQESLVADQAKHSRERKIVEVCWYFEFIC